MSEERCDNCMFSSDTEISSMLSGMMNNMNYMYCNHPNSPNFMGLVDCEESCRLFENERLYFLKKDRKDKIDKLNDKDFFNYF